MATCILNVSVVLLELVKVKQNIHFSILQSIRPRIPTSSKVSLSLVKAEVGANKEKTGHSRLGLVEACVLKI